MYMEKQIGKDGNRRTVVACIGSYNLQDALLEKDRLLPCDPDIIIKELRHTGVAFIARHQSAAPLTISCNGEPCPSDKTLDRELRKFVNDVIRKIRKG